MSEVSELVGAEGWPPQLTEWRVTGGPDALAGVARSLAALEREVADLWRDTIDSPDVGWSDRLVDVSRSLRRTSALLQAEPWIGQRLSPTAHDDSASAAPRPPLFDAGQIPAGQ